MRAPGPYEAQHAMSVLLTARDQLIADEKTCDDESWIMDYLASDPITCDAEQMVRDTVRAIMYCRGQAEMAAKWEKEACERKTRYVERAKLLKAALLQAMLALDKKRHEMPEAVLLVRKGQPELIIDEAQLPDPYWRHPKPEPNRTAIRDALELGMAVPGAQFGNAAPSLAVQTK